MSIFKRNSFDSYTSPGVEIRGGHIFIASGETFISDGKILGMNCIRGGSTSSAGLDLKVSKSDMKTKLVIDGELEAQHIEVPNVVVTGRVKTKILRVEGTLAIKAGAKIEADVIMYRNLVVENSAVISAKMQHLDHISDGEKPFIEP